MDLTDRSTQSRVANIDGSEWRFVAIIIAIVLVVTTLPYVYGYASAPPDKQFMGIMLDAPDHWQYFSWMRELSRAPLAANKLTPEPNRPVFFNLLWWAMGRVGRLLGLGYAGMYQLLRLTTGVLFLLLVYRICAWFLNDRLMRRAAFLVATFTSGFGWVLIVLKYTLTKGKLLFPLDVYIAEGNTSLCILGYPHFIAAALYICVFDLVLRTQAKSQLRYPMVAGLLALFLGWQHAYDLALVYGVLLAYTVLLTLRDRCLPPYMIKTVLIVGLVSWWPALYSVILTSADPVWRQALAQFKNAGVYTPNLLHLPILLGSAFLLASFTLIRDNPLRLKGLNNNELFLRAWFLANFFLIYLPVDFRIHFLNGWQVPIAILATQGVFRYVVPFAQRVIRQREWSLSPTIVRRCAAVALVLAVLPTNLYIWAWRFVDLARHEHPYYLYKDEIAAMHWLEDNAKPDDVVLSSRTVGQYIPALTGAHAFLAHWAQTLDFHENSAMVGELYAQSTRDARRRQILERYEVDYVFWGVAERALGSFPLDESALLRRVFSSGRTQVYEVQW